MKEDHRSYRSTFSSLPFPVAKRKPENIQRPAPGWLVRSIGRALHRYRRGQGFESRTSLNFFQAFFSQLQKLRL